MQKVVLDTNLLFSSLLCQNERRREVLFSKELQFYCPNYVFVELFKHKEKVMRCTKAAETEVYEFLTAILEHIRFVNPELISLPNREAAYRLCADIDEHDTAFVALTLELDAVLWTGDKTLRDGLRKKGFDRFFVEPGKGEEMQDISS
jgi:putative PIN family toxin of toxin-antitoxin system